MAQRAGISSDPGHPIVVATARSYLMLPAERRSHCRPMPDGTPAPSDFNLKFSSMGRRQRPRNRWVVRAGRRATEARRIVLRARPAAARIRCSNANNRAFVHLFANLRSSKERARGRCILASRRTRTPGSGECHDYPSNGPSGRSTSQPFSSQRLRSPPMISTCRARPSNWSRRPSSTPMSRPPRPAEDHGVQDDDPE